MGRQKVKGEAVEGRAYDDQGNVRPADGRFLGRGSRIHPRDRERGAKMRAEARAKAAEDAGDEDLARATRKAGHLDGGPPDTRGQGSGDPSTKEEAGK
ncbi:MAG TPA: hypothetical protein VGD43_17545 [Micromonospora sp.]